MLGADRVVATKLEIIDGRYTGEIDYYAYAEEKAKAIVALAEERGYDLEACYGYSDSSTDIPMLEAVGHPHVVNPDRELRRYAATHAWPVLIFSKPVGLRSRVPLPAPKPTLAALAVGGAVAVGAVVWVGVKRRGATSA
jgi:phosphoserine phosphatase